MAPVPAPALPVVTSSFTLSGGGDQADLTSGVSINEGTIQVPEPATMMLMLVGVAAAARRRMRA